MTYILRDCVEYDCVYRILHFTEGDIKRIDVDNTINKIKNNFEANDFSGWTIDDVLEELSKNYTFIVYDFDGFLEV